MNIPIGVQEGYIADLITSGARRLEPHLVGLQGEIRPREQLAPLLRSVLAFAGGSRERMILLSGLRGTGKTTMMAQLHQELRGIASLENHVYYFSADELWQTYGITLKALFSHLEAYHGERFEGLQGKRTVILLDEVQYSPGWSLDLKILYDRSVRVMVIASGSSALDMSMEGDLSRRASAVDVAPLDLVEYAYLRNGLALEPEARRKLIAALVDSSDATECYSRLGEAKGQLDRFIASLGPNERDRYLRYGSMPCSINAVEESSGHMSSIRILERVINYDLPRLGRFDVATLDKTWALLTLLSQSGRLSYEKLSGALAMSKITLAAVLQGLRQAGVLVRVMPFGSEYGRQVRTPTYSFASPSLRAAVIWRSGGMTTSSFAVGAMLEDAAFASMQRLLAAHAIAGHGFDPCEGGADMVMRRPDGKALPIEVGRGSKDSSQVRATCDRVRAPFGIVASSIPLTRKDDTVFIPWEWLLLL
jgi:predicted AAA+ superfamily ATPase